MSIAESQRTKLLELRVAELERRLDAIELAPAVERYIAPVEPVLLKRGPGRPPKVKDGH